MRIDIRHRVAVICVQNCLLKFCLYQEEVNIDDSEISSHKVALALEMIVGDLQGILEEPIYVVVLIYVNFDMTISLVADGPC